MKLYALTCLLLAGLAASEKNYQGHHVLSTMAQTKQQVALLHNLRDNHDVVFLRDPSTMQSTDFVVPVEERAQVWNTLKDAGMAVTVQATDLQAQMDRDKRNNLVIAERSQRNHDPFPAHDAYYTLSQVNRYLANFEARFPRLAARKMMGRKTHENRTVYYMEIGTPGYNKPVIFIEGLAHAREWVSTASLLYTIHMMLQGYHSGEQAIREALTQYTWIIIPVVNPDGYEYTWNHDRLWRNNRRHFNSWCTGVNLNRNYDVEFATTGVSAVCGSENYPGEAAFSEPETQNVRDLFLQLKSRIVGFLSVHAYSQLLLYPWGYIDSDHVYEVPGNLDKLIRVGQKMKRVLRNYRFGTAHGVLGYGASGAAEDWALKEKPGIYSYCYELRPRSFYEGHFLLPPSQIRPTGHEFMLSVLALAKGIADEDRWVWSR
ncbi:zinc carboxypeptidase-like [Babylonia areolata]|uniref:zinc carboxypeptidase-like n=1 Tax=Babylonia areolata TaxID=304850 RepID=UPI003FD02771